MGYDHYQKVFPPEKTYLLDKDERYGYDENRKSQGSKEAMLATCVISHVVATPFDKSPQRPKDITEYQYRQWQF
jgi:hypothetical protein